MNGWIVGCLECWMVDLMECLMVGQFDGGKDEWLDIWSVGWWNR